MLGCVLAMITRDCERVHPADLGAKRPPVRGPGADVGQPATDLGAGSAARAGVGAAVEGCARCAETGRTCPSCVQRRRRAWSLVMESEETCDGAGRIMELD